MDNNSEIKQIFQHLDISYWVLLIPEITILYIQYLWLQAKDHQRILMEQIQIEKHVEITQFMLVNSSYYFFTSCL
jgi:hypothetical protein